MRIASHTLADTLANSVAKNQMEYGAEQIRISSGKAYQKRSENCDDAARAAGLQQSRALAAQFQSNIQQATAWTSVTESRLTSIVDQMARVQEIGVEGNDSTLTGSAREALAQELDGLLEDLLAQANAQYDDAPVFGSTGAASEPVAATRDANGRLLGVTYAAGTDTARSVQANGTTSVAYGTCATGPDGVFADSASGRDLFQSVIDLRDQIRTGGAVTDTTLAAVADSCTGATQALLRTGLQGNRLATLEQQAGDLDVVQQKRLSELTDTDLASAISRLSELEASLQASLQMASSVGDMSLAKYI